jgi:peptide/nickel transport system permease protein
VLNYTLRRLLLMVPTLVLIMTVVFAVVKAVPGGPFSAPQGAGEGTVRRMNPEDYQALLARYGLDRPWYDQYLLWLRGAATGSFGDSFAYRTPVLRLIFSDPSASGRVGFLAGFTASRFAATLFLNALAMALVFAVALPVGFRAAARRGGWFDRTTSWVLYGLYAMPNFWLAVLLIILFGVHWRVLPFLGMHSDGYAGLSAAAKVLDVLRHAVLPAVCLAAGSMAFLARFARGVVADVLGQDYIRTARAKGLGERDVLLRHAARNALIPLLTLLGLLLPALISGSVIIEQIFAWPGLGQLTIQSIEARDYPVIMALALLGAVAVLVSNLLTDLSYHLADPRLRLE